MANIAHLNKTEVRGRWFTMGFRDEWRRLSEEQKSTDAAKQEGKQRKAAAKQEAKRAQWAQRGVLYEAEGYADGSKETLTVYPDRVGWVRHAKIGALLSNADRASETMPLSKIASCVVEKDGLVRSTLKVHGSGNHIEFRASHPEANEAKQAVLNAMNSDTAESAAPEAAPQDDADEIRKLAQLRDDGILSEAEFEAKKRQILGLD